MHLTFSSDFHPIAGESILGMLSRACAGTVFMRPAAALISAGVVPTRSSMSWQPDEVERIARRLGVEEREVASRCLFQPERPLTDQLEADFFGVPVLGKLLFKKERRRVSPRALKISAHHRAIWDLRPLSFDPETGESLMLRCPECNHELGWSRFFGPEHCDMCATEDGFPAVDLRDYDQPLVQDELLQRMRIVTDLVHFDVSVREASQDKVAAVWSYLSPGELFALALDLADCFEAVRNHVVIGNGKKNVYKALSNESLASAAVVLLEGRSALEAAIEIFRSQPHRSGLRYGIFKELGVGASLRDSPRLSPRTRIVLHRELGLIAAAGNFGRPLPDADWVDARTVSEKLSMPYSRILKFVSEAHPDTIEAQYAPRPSRLLQPAALTAAAEAAASAITAHRGVAKLGIWKQTLEELASAGALKSIEGDALHMMSSKPAYTKESFERLESCLNALLYECGAPEGTPIKTLLREAGFRPIPWAAAFLALMSGKVPCSLPPEYSSRKGKWFPNVLVSDHDTFLNEVEKALGRVPAGPSTVDLVPSRVAAEIVGITLMGFHRLVSAGLISEVSKNPMLFCRADLVSFNGKYVLGRELLKLLGCTKGNAGRAKLIKLGAGSGLALPDSNDVVYLRQRVEAALRHNTQFKADRSGDRMGQIGTP